MQQLILIFLLLFSAELIAEKCQYRISGLRFYKKNEKSIFLKFQDELGSTPHKVNINKRKDLLMIQQSTHTCKEIRKMLKNMGFRGIVRKKSKTEKEDFKEKLFDNPEFILKDR